MASKMLNVTMNSYYFVREKSIFDGIYFLQETIIRPVKLKTDCLQTLAPNLYDGLSIECHIPASLFNVSKSQQLFKIDFVVFILRICIR